MAESVVRWRKCVYYMAVSIVASGGWLQTKEGVLVVELWHW